MTPVGFSTGALAKGDFCHALTLMRGKQKLGAIELSALREFELERLAQTAPTLDLAQFSYVSVHAPSKLNTVSEHAAFDLLSSLPSRWPIVAHPELVRTPSLWRRLGARLCLENMDNRKTTARTVDEMRHMFATYPEASFCLDLGHARQVDPTMASAVRMASEFRSRLKQIHLSEVGPRGEHLPLSVLATFAFQLVSTVIPSGCAVIIESVIRAQQMDCEMKKAIGLFSETRKTPSMQVALDLAC